MNMTYCMFENTSGAMRQLLNAMEHVDSLYDLDLNRTETRGFRELVNQCEAFLAEAERLENGDTEREHDGQPSEAQEWADFDPEC